MATALSTLRLAAFLFLAAALTACGGGGGDTPPDVTPPTLTLATSSPIGVTATVVFTADETLAGTPRVEAAGYPRLTRGTAAVLPGTAVLSADARSILWTPTNQLGYDWVIVLKASAEDASGNTGTLSTSVNTVLQPPAPGWPPQTIAEQGVKVFGANQLPAGCDSAQSACWQQAVADGTVKFVAAGGSGPDGRAIVFAYFRNTTSRDGVNGLWNVVPFFRDNGTAVPMNSITGGFSTEIDWVVGSSAGVITHQVGQASCTEYTYNGGNLWTPRGVACP